MERRLLSLGFVCLFFFYIYFIKCMHMYATVCGGQRTIYRKSVLTHHMGPRDDQIQVIRLGLKYLYPLSHLVDLWISCSLFYMGGRRMGCACMNVEYICGGEGTLCLRSWVSLSTMSLLGTRDLSQVNKLDSSYLYLLSFLAWVLLTSFLYTHIQLEIFLFIFGSTWDWTSC